MSCEVFEASIEELPSILDHVRKQLKKTALPTKEQMQMELALEEAIVNIIHHAKASKITLSVRSEPKQIEFELTDSGVAFNPLEQPAANTDLSLEDRTPGGLGIHLMRKCVDTLLYRNEANKNILTLVKKIG